MILLLKIFASFIIEVLKDKEKSSLNALQSLVAANDIPKVKIIENSDLTFNRLAFGISPKYIDDVLLK